MGDRLWLLGTGDSLGVPRVYCDCEVCQEARRLGRNRRTRCSALLRTDEGDLLLDCGPDFRVQMERMELRHVESVLITHGHHDHIGGIGDLADSVRWTGLPLRLLGPAPALDEIRARFPWAMQGFTTEAISRPVTLVGWSVICWPVNHGKNGTAFAYRFERPGFAWAYCPDSIHLSPAEEAPLQGLDLLVLGTAYYEERAPESTRSLYSMVEALELLERVRPGRTVFTHLSHGVDIGADYGLPSSVAVGFDGFSIELGGRR